MNRETLAKASPEEAAALTKEMQLQHWDRISGFCGSCGKPNEMHDSEVAKCCKSCERTYYPLIQPVAIVLVRQGNDLLLARGLAPRKHHSCLAGFVEVGETVEQCIHREIKEEVGIEVENLKYFGSQPWPFPSNLMLAFIAEYKSGDIVLDETEITDARWFRQDQPPEMISPKLSIARQMIDSVWGD